MQQLCCSVTFSTGCLLTCVWQETVAFVAGYVIYAGSLIQARVGSTFVDIGLAVGPCVRRTKTRISKLSSDHDGGFFWHKGDGVIGKQGGNECGNNAHLAHRTHWLPLAAGSHRRLRVYYCSQLKEHLL